MTATIGDPQVRNWGTIGGSVAHADPASDWPAALLAVNATIVCRSQSGEREIAARDFFLDTFTDRHRADRGPDRDPHRFAGRAHRRRLREARAQGRRLRHGRCRRDRVGWTTDGHIERAGIGLTGVAETPFAATDAEAVLVGNAPSDDLFRAAGAAAGAQSRPVGDVRGPVEYKRAMAAEMTLRALRRATERALAYA